MFVLCICECVMTVGIARVVWLRSCESVLMEVMYGLGALCVDSMMGG